MLLKKENRNLSLLVFGQIISLFGSAIQRFALSLYLLDVTGSASIFASILALSMVPYIVMAPIAGVVADHADRKKTMVVLDIISGLVITAYAVLLFAGKGGAGSVAVVMVLLAAISTIYQPVVNSSIPSIVKEENLVSANGIVQQVSSLSNFLGPILAGVLYGFWGIRGVIILNALSFFFSAVMELFLVIPHVKKEKMHSPFGLFKSEMREIYKYLRKDNPIIFRMIVTSGLYNLFMVPVFSVGAPYIIKVTLGISSELYGVAEGVIALGMIIGGAIISAKPTLVKMNRIYRVLYISCVSMAMMAVSLVIFRPNGAGKWGSYVMFTFFGMMIMLALGIANVITMTYNHTAIPPHMLGKIMAFASAFATICIPLGQILFGWLLELFSDKVSLLVFVAAIFTTLVTLIVRFNVRGIES
ncbi:MAG: MFS transporter [Lachnospiraceae bacterium]|nr:MFS transporter [Lachnospiraceae bacterium]